MGKNEVCFSVVLLLSILLAAVAVSTFVEIMLIAATAVPSAMNEWMNAHF